MNKLFAVMTFALVASPAFAGVRQVPEMSVGAGFGAIALVIGAVAILRERRKK